MVSWCSNQGDRFDGTFSPDGLPQLKNLRFGHHFNQPLVARAIQLFNALPCFVLMAYNGTDSVCRLTTYSAFYFRVGANRTFCILLRYLEMDLKSFFPRFSNQIFPNSGYLGWESLDFQVQLPETLLSLTFGRRFHQPLSNISWPPHLEKLDMGECKFFLDEAVLPQTLRTLRVGTLENCPQTLSLDLDEFRCNLLLVGRTNLEPKAEWHVREKGRLQAFFGSKPWVLFWATSVWGSITDGKE